MRLSIDVGQYLELPPGVKARFDGWLQTEALADKGIVKLRLGEAFVIVVQECRDEHGRAYLDDTGEIAVEIAVYPVGSPPPREAFTESGGN